MLCQRCNTKPANVTISYQREPMELCDTCKALYFYEYPATKPKQSIALATDLRYLVKLAEDHGRSEDAERRRKARLSVNTIFDDLVSELRHHASKGRKSTKEAIDAAAETGHSMPFVVPAEVATYAMHELLTAFGNAGLQTQISWLESRKCYILEASW